MVKKERLLDISKELDDFISKEVKLCGNGTYFLKRGIYVNVEEYFTYAREERTFESHKKYIDYQYIIEGSEVIELAPVNKLRKKTSFDYQKDIDFYWNNYIGEKIFLNSGEGIFIYPETGHMPCLSSSETMKVRKAVAKIPLSLTKQIKLLVMDVDGTLTDGKINMACDGEIFKSFNIKDGLAVKEILKRKGILSAIITGRKSSIVEKRCNEMSVDKVFQGIEDKLATLKSLIKEFGIDISNVAYVGDDINDIATMQYIKDNGGVIGCPVDAVQDVKLIADFVSIRAGGDGAVREFIEWITL